MESSPALGSNKYSMSGIDSSHLNGTSNLGGQKQQKKVMQMIRNRISA